MKKIKKLVMVVKAEIVSYKGKDYIHATGDDGKVYRRVEKPKRQAYWEIVSNELDNYLGKKQFMRTGVGWYTSKRKETSL